MQVSKLIFILRGRGTGEAAASPNFRGLLKGNCNDFGKKKGEKFSASPKKTRSAAPGQSRNEWMVNLPRERAIAAAFYHV